MRLSSRSRAKQLGALSVCVLLLTAAALAQQPKIKLIHASSDHPLWRVDLNSVGYPTNSDELQRRRGFANFDSISFVSDNILAATFVTRENIPDLQRRDDPNHARPYRLHAIFLDALTGKIIHSLDWPIENPNAGIFPRHDGGIVLVTTEKIASYSSDWTQLKEVPLSDLQPASAKLGGIAESPSAKSLVIQFIAGNSALCLSIRTETLESNPIPCRAFQVFTASDNEVITPYKFSSDTAARGKSAGGVYVQYGAVLPDALAERASNTDRGQSRREICNPCAGIPQFIDNDTMAIYTPTSVGVVDRTGKVAFGDDYSLATKWIDEFGRPLRVSRNGQRFAIASNVPQRDRANFRPSEDDTATVVDVTSTDYSASVLSRDSQSKVIMINFSVLHMSTADLPAEFPLEVEVYDRAAAQRIYTLQVDSNHIHKIWGLALSPNGEALAIDSGGAIQVFALPSSNTSPK